MRYTLDSRPITSLSNSSRPTRSMEGSCPPKRRCDGWTVFLPQNPWGRPLGEWSVVPVMVLGEMKREGFGTWEFQSSFFPRRHFDPAGHTMDTPMQLAGRLPVYITSFYLHRCVHSVSCRVKMWYVCLQILESVITSFLRSSRKIPARAAPLSVFFARKMAM